MSFDELLRETNGLLEESYPDFKKAAEEKRRKCKESMEAMSKLMKGQLHCPWEFDLTETCWPPSLPGKTVYNQCPNFSKRKVELASRECLNDGTWKMDDNSTNVYVDFSKCLNFSKNFGSAEDDDAPSESGNKMKLLLTAGYSTSAVFLFAAMFVFVYYRRLHCTRNRIHLHLFASFFLRAVMLLVKDAVLFSVTGVYDPFATMEQLTDPNLDPERRAELYKQLMSPDDKNMKACKIVVSLYHFFVATNYFWILVEGVYLHCLIFVTFFAEKKYMLRFVLIGWGLPLLFVVPWSLVNEVLSENKNKCWNVERGIHDWLFNGPIIAANFVNFLLFVNIVRVLWYKLRYAGGCNHPEIGNQYKKLAKSTLVLIPMFGVHAIIFRGIPDSSTGIVWEIRMYLELFFDSFQGFFVAIIYCFINGEVLGELKRSWHLIQTTCQIQRNQRVSTRPSNTYMTNMSTSASNFPLRSMASPQNKRISKYDELDETNIEKSPLKEDIEAEKDKSSIKIISDKKCTFDIENAQIFENEPLINKNVKPDCVTDASVSPVYVITSGEKRSSTDSGINSLLTSSMNRRSSNLENDVTNSKDNVSGQPKE